MWGIMSESVMTRTLTDTPPFSSRRLPRSLTTPWERTLPGGVARSHATVLRPPSFTHVDASSVGTDWSVLTVAQHTALRVTLSPGIDSIYFVLDPTGVRLFIRYPEILSQLLHGAGNDGWMKGWIDTWMDGLGSPYKNLRLCT